METLKLKRQFTLNRTKVFLSQWIKRLNAYYITVPINRCRHYCAFKYGCSSFNPYENYISGLHKGNPISDLHFEFEEFLRYFRPRNFGEALNIPFEACIPLWYYPWQKYNNLSTKNGWMDNINEVPDIITHFSESGIKRSRINEEYNWLEGALSKVSRYGYRPREYSYIEAFQIRNNRESVYVITDGNHRISSLAALGFENVLIKVSRLDSVNSKDIHKWRQVRQGNYKVTDAIKLIDVYLEGVDEYQRSHQPGKILEFA